MKRYFVLLTMNIFKNLFKKKKKEILVKTVSEDGTTRPYTEYENKSVIIGSKEELKNFIGKKLKKSWFNDRGKFCLKSFIYLGDDKEDENTIIYVDVINGIATNQREKVSKDELFGKYVVFAGYISDRTEIEGLLKLKIQGVNY